MSFVRRLLNLKRIGLLGRRIRPIAGTKSDWVMLSPAATQPVTTKLTTTATSTHSPSSLD